MKRIQSLMATIIVLVVFTGTLSAQKKQIGLEIGRGLTKFDEDMLILYPFMFYPTENFYFSYMRLGLNYYYTPGTSKTAFKTGLIYDKISNNSPRFHYLRIPAGIEIILGKNLQFICGFGFYTGCLFAFSQKRPSDINYSLKRFQVGYQYNAGIGYSIFPLWNLQFSFQNNADLTNTFKRDELDCSGHHISYERGYNSFIQVTLKYTLSSE